MKLIFIFASLLCFASDCEIIFTEKWNTNAWGGQSLSGTGSDLTQTEVIRKMIPALLEKYRCKTIVDAPCGDFYWMQHADLPVDKYIGIDIVLPLIVTNQIQFGDKKFSFIHLNLIEEVVPKADLILCRDCLVHFSYEDITKTIQNFKKSGSTYLLTTCFTRDHPDLNEAIGTGSWRSLDLRKAPYFFPAPLEILNENCTEAGPDWNDKSLFLWAIKDLPDL